MADPEVICNLALRDTFLARAYPMLGKWDSLFDENVRQAVIEMVEHFHNGRDGIGTRTSPASTRAMLEAYNDIADLCDDGHGPFDIPQYETIRRMIKDGTLTVSTCQHGRKNLRRNGKFIPSLNEIYNVAINILSHDEDFSEVDLWLDVRTVAKLRKTLNDKLGIMVTKSVLDAIYLEKNDPLCRGCPYQIMQIYKTLLSIKFAARYGDDDSDEDDIGYDDPNPRPTQRPRYGQRASVEIESQYPFDADDLVHSWCFINMGIMYLNRTCCECKIQRFENIISGFDELHIMRVAAKIAEGQKDIMLQSQEGGDGLALTHLW